MRTTGASQVSAGPLILVIENEAELRRYLRSLLAQSHFMHVETSTAQEGIVQAQTRFPDLILLDLDLPEMESLGAIRQVRDRTMTPILLLTGRGRDQDVVHAIDAGANDYLTKPIASDELLTRMQIALHRDIPHLNEDELSEYVVNEFRMDLTHRQVYVGNREIHLTPIEYKLLSILVRHAGRVVTREQLLKEVWGPGCISKSHYLRIYMTYLRHKLEDDAEQPQYLINEPGVGYRVKAKI